MRKKRSIPDDEPGDLRGDEDVVEGALTRPDSGRSPARSSGRQVTAPAHLGYGSGVDLRDEQPDRHEIGNRTYIVADVEVLDADGVRAVEVGTALWFLCFLALLPFYGRLEDADRLWWLWTCLSGAGLGLLGLEYCRRRRRERRARGAAGPPT